MIDVDLSAGGEETASGFQHQELGRSCSWSPAHPSADFIGAFYAGFIMSSGAGVINSDARPV